MNAIEMGYELLVLLAISDNHFHHNEKVSIKNFLMTHFNEKKDFEVQSPRKFFSLDAEEKIQRVIEIAEFFKNEHIKNKIRMVNFALGLIISDRKVTAEERLRFKIVGEYWGVDLERFIDKKIAKVRDNK